MDRITLAGHSAPAAVQSGGTIAGVSRPAPVLANAYNDNASPRQQGGDAVETTSRADEALSPEGVQQRAVEAVRAAINAAGEAIDQGAKLVIRKDDDTGRFVYEFRDPGTGEVTRQFPAEEVLRALASFRQAMTGKVIDRTA